MDRTRWSRRANLWLFALSGLCIALAVLVFFAGDTYYLVDRVLPPAFWFFTVSTVIQAASSFDERRGAPVWGLRALVVVLCLAGALGGYMVHSANPPALSSARSPDGRITAEVRDGAPTVNIARMVIVHQNAGLLSRKWTVGCVHGDGPDAYESVAWLDDMTLEVRTQNGQRLPVSLDPTGRPLNRLSALEDTCP
ncbi:hypothetical protein BJ986_001456 [Phycicoccus badiiscoriae]|uniref:Uncharacterized protein n=1 Tax=Pedococcus badiiscoriae TaxID=642776 RepID=A0A852WDV6_9MICO|nr:hypothetical protein [Pedococcus badiiscoriae]NYG06969.1 hypothetical protein [Pedococcus badiiscoriae]